MATYTLAQVKQHRTRNDLWVVHDGKVYDVTKFVKRHPGGADILEEHAGENVTELMKQITPHRHTSAAYNILKKYFIGNLDTSDNNNTNYKKTKNATSTSDVAVDDLINWDKPIAWQVGKLGDRYLEWAHSPIDHDLRFFESDILEYLTTCQWYVIPIVWVPIVLLFSYLSFSNFSAHGPELFLPWLFGGINLSSYHVPLLIFGGVIMWTFGEYILHRWVFHLKPPASSKVLITLHFLIHGQHHKNPMNKDRLVFPPAPASIFAAVFYFAYTWCFPYATSQALIAGTALGYIMYDLTHYYLHHGTPSTAYFKDLKKYHMNHHYVHQEKGFGISCKLWDYPFQTLMPPDNELASKYK